MSKNHNKRRNAGLLYEFLVRSISQSLVEGNTKRSNAALKLVRRHFKPGCELYKEFRLANSLYRTTVSSDAIAASIVHEAKAAAKAHDGAQLDREKSLLINAINRSVNDPDVYERNVYGYRTLATIQTLFNDWRSPKADLGRIAQYEDELVKWLVTEKAVAPDTQMPTEEGPGEGRLLMRALMKRLNEKYSGTLNSTQKQLLRAYAFSAANDDPNSIRLKLLEIKDKLIEQITSCPVDSVGPNVSEKLIEAKSQLEAESLTEVDDAAVTRFMLYAKLSEELAGEGK